MVAVLQVNDCGLLIQSDGAELLESPGYMAFDGKQVHVGTAAAECVKLIPTQTHYSYWEKFSTDPLEIAQQSRIPAKTQADLAFAHLKWLWDIVGNDIQQLLICVPADMDRTQLSLLLGMCRNLKIPVKALLDTAVAASSQPVPGRQLMHVDLHLHRVVVSRLEQGAWLSTSNVTSTREVGLVRLMDAWAHAVAAMFVQGTRFDPLHHAETEQQLFDRLPAWLSGVTGEAQLALDLSRGEQRFEIKAPSQPFLTAVEPLYRRLREFVGAQLPPDKPVTIQVGARLARLPGAMAALGALPDVELVACDRLACGQAAQRLYLPRDAGQDGQVPHVTRLPWFKSNQMEHHAEQLAGYQRAQPTHLLHQATAYPLDEHSEFWVGSELDGRNGLALRRQLPGIADRHFRLRGLDGNWVLEDLSGGATQVNDEVLEGRREVAAGDRIRIGSPAVEFLLIAEAEVKVT